MICGSLRSVAQISPDIDKALAQGIRLTRVPEDYKPLVMVDGEPYNGSLSRFRSSSIESVRILDSVTAHAVWDGPGVHGAIEITTKKYKIEQCMTRLSDFGSGLKNFMETHPGNENLVYHLNGMRLTGDKYIIATKLYNIPTSDIIFVRTLDLGNYAIVSVRTKGK